MSTDGKKKLGRPTVDEPPRPQRRVLSLSLDDEMYAIIDALTSDVERQVRIGRKTVAVRRALIEAFERRQSKNQGSK